MACILMYEGSHHMVAFAVEGFRDNDGSTDKRAKRHLLPALSAA